MYGVLRFIGANEIRREGLEALGLMLNAHLPGSYDGLDGERQRFSVVVVADCAQDGLSRAIVAYLVKAEEVIRMALAQDVALELDFAIEPKDIAGRLYFSVAFEPELLEKLSNLRIQLVLTAYAP